MGLGDVAEIVIAGVVIIALFGGGAYLMDIFDFIDDEMNSVVIEVEGDEGISSISGDGKHREGDPVTLSVIVYLGWILDGWYSDTGEFLSKDYEYEFDAKETKLSVRTHRGYGVEIFSMDGAFTEGRNSYEFGESATVSVSTRSDTKFLGWYDVEGNLLSTKGKYTVPEQKDTTLIAMTDGDDYKGEITRTITAPSDMDPSTITWAINTKYTRDYADSATGQSFVTHLDPGFYTLTMSGYKTDGTYVKTHDDFSIEGDITSHYHWYYAGKWYSMDWTISSDVFDRFENADVDRSPQDDRSRAAFVNYKSASVQDVAGSLLELGRGMDEAGYANFVLKFVQRCTEYELDTDFIGIGDYWKCPVQTLMHHKGDCEDTTILYCALMKASGFDSALLIYLGGEYIDRGHAAAGVDLDYCPGGTYYYIDGKHYYYCETTGDTNVGDIWELYNKARIIEIV